MRPALDPGARLHRLADDRVSSRFVLQAGSLRAGQCVAVGLLCADRNPPPVGATVDAAVARRGESCDPAGGSRRRLGDDEFPALRHARYRAGPVARSRCPCGRNLGQPGRLVLADPHQANLARRLADSGAFSDRAGGGGADRACPVPVHLPSLRRTDRPAAWARGAGHRAFDARIHVGLRAAATPRAVDVAGRHCAVGTQRRHHRLPDGPARRCAGVPVRRTQGGEPLLLRDRAEALRTVPRLHALPLGNHPARERNLRYPRHCNARLLCRRGYFRVQARRRHGVDCRHRLAVHGCRCVLARTAPAAAYRRDADAPLGGAKRIGDRSSEARMQGVKHPVVKDVVLIGAGHAHVAVLRMFGMAPLPGARLTLITREVHTPYSGMLPGLIAGHYRFDDAHIDTGPLARFAGARLYQDEVVGLDLANRRVICRHRTAVPYDLLSINIGSTPNTAQIPGASDHAIPVKPIDGFLGRFVAMKDRVIERKGRARIALVGAGAGGVELLLSVAQRLRREAASAGFDPAGLSFALVTDAPDILPTFPRKFRDSFHHILAERGITVVAGAAVTRVEAGRLVLDGQGPIDADEILWTTQARPAEWLGNTGLAVDQRGFLAVEPTLCARGRDDVFAAGDAIAFSSRELPKSGVYAVRAGPVLADNIRRALTGRALRAFRPQREAMYLVSTGDAYAVGTRNGLVFAGAWVWRWKDWIDRRFM